MIVTSDNMQDLLLIHWPGAAHLVLTSPLHAKLRLQTWRVLEDIYSAGRSALVNHNYLLVSLPSGVIRLATQATVNFFSGKEACSLAAEASEHADVKQ